MTQLKKNQPLENTSRPVRVETQLPYAEVVGIGKFKINQDLGPIQSGFEQTIFTSKQRKISLSLICAAAAVFVFGAVRYIYGYWVYGYAVGINWSQVWFKVGLGILIFWILHYLILSLNRKAAFIYRNGISLHKPGKKQIIYSWTKLAGFSYLQENISFLFFKGTKYNGYIFPNQGKKVKLNTYLPNQEIKNFITHVKAYLYPILEPELIKKLSAGQTLYFGAVTISDNEITIKNKTYPWNIIEQMVIRDGYMQFHFRNNGTSELTSPHKEKISLIDILNPELLLKLAKRIHEEELKTLH